LHCLLQKISSRQPWEIFPRRFLQLASQPWEMFFTRNHPGSAAAKRVLVRRQVGRRRSQRQATDMINIGEVCFTHGALLRPPRHRSQMTLTYHLMKHHHQLVLTDGRMYLQDWTESQEGSWSELSKRKWSQWGQCQCDHALDLIIIGTFLCTS
jgi:hypothetical protein